ncbi:MAG: tetratricopeptide repeat protein [Candidatus Korobacteraceae bacterium]
MGKALAGEAETVKEYLIGLEVFHRRPDYDPATDPIVRAEARRLRARLAEYYGTLGEHNPVRFALPKGTYVPVFYRNGTETPPAETEPEPQLVKPAAGAQDSAIVLPADRFPRRWLAFAAVVVMALIAGGLYWKRSHKTPARFTDKDSIVLADFDNKTGDAVFDDTLKQGLAIQLWQSPFLYVLPDRKVGAILKLMGRTASDRLTPEVTRELCVRTASTAMFTGWIAKLGKQYVIGLKAVNCSAGDVLAEAQEQAATQEDVLKALDAAAISLRGQLGESLSSVQKYATPLKEATTPSLEALKAYSLGLKTSRVKGDTAALPFFKRALELDPNFAVAYNAIASSYNNLGEVARSQESVRKAFDLREKLSEHERLSIEATYYLYVTGELEKAAQAYERWQQIYPRDYLPYTDLSFIYGNLGNFEESVKPQREAIRMEPNDEVSYSNLGNDYVALNRLDDADAVYQQAEERKLQGESLLLVRYLLAFLKGDTAQMTQLASAATGKPGTEDVLLNVQADTEAWYGKWKSARELIRRAMDSAQHNDAKETAAGYQVEAAMREADLGNNQQARADASAAIKLTPNRDVRSWAALALARSGDTAEAEKLAVELDKAFPLDTLVQKYRLPTIRAAVALQRKDPNRAVELLKVASPVELGDTGFLLPIYVRGEAYLMLHDGRAAAAEFQEFVVHYGLVGNSPWGPLARLGLARAYALDAAKDPAAREKARIAYQNFLTLWKDADPDIPIYKQAKAEYAKLK